MWGIVCSLEVSYIPVGEILYVWCLPLVTYSASTYIHIYCNLHVWIKGTARALYPVHAERAQYGQC